jgi:predicted secreted protein
MLVSAKGGAPRVFGTRWAMSYLRGPLTKEEVERLMSTAPRPVAAPTVAEAAAAVPLAADETSVAPVAAPGVGVSYLDPAAPWAAQIGATAGSTSLHAFVATRVSLRYDDTAAGIDETQEFEALYGPLDGGLDLDAETVVDFDDRDFREEAPGGAAYVLPAAPVAEARFFTEATRDIQARLVANRALEIFRNRTLKLTSRPGETEEAFLARCDEAGQVKADEETVKLTKRLEAKKDRLESALALARSRVEELDTQTKSRQANELITGAGAVLGALFGGKRSARSITSAVGSVASKHGQSATSSARRDTAEEKVQQTTDDLAELEQEIVDEVSAIDEKWRAAAEEIEPVAIRLEATDVRVTDVRLVWVPVD